MKILSVICCICAVFLLSCSPEVAELPVEKEVKKSEKPVEKYILSTETYQKPVKTAENDEKSVVLCGKAFYDNDTVVSEFYVSAIPRGADESTGTNGHVKNRLILTDPNGNFEISGLREAFYTLDLMCTDAIPIQTNMQIIADESFLDLEFVKAPSVSGMVVLAESGEPIPDVMVHFSSQSTSLPPQTVTTDSNGEFSLPVPVNQRSYGILEVKEAGYSPVKVYLRLSNVHDTYVLKLRRTGIITGKVINQFDKPVKDVFVETRPRKWNNEETDTKPVDRNMQERIRSWYSVRSETPTDELGQFVISNAAAPAMHGVHAEWLNNLHYKPGDHVFVTVTPGKIASVELRIIEKPNLLLKVRDSKGTPVLDYNLAIKSRTEHTYMSSGRHVIHRTDAWERVTVGIQESVAKGILNLAVTAPSGGRAVTNNIVCLVGTTNCVVLVLDDSEPVTVAGVIMTTDGTPVADNDMHANYSLGSLRSRTDHTGNFFLENISAETNSFITLGCIYNGEYYSTNVCISTKFIEWKLPKSKPKPPASNNGDFDLFSTPD